MSGQSSFVFFADLDEWEECRIRFNHDWLRNRCAITFGKLVNVLNGTVSDPNTVSDVFNVLNQWCERHVEAARLISSASKVLAPSRFLDTRIFSALEEDAKKFFGEVADTIWLKKERVLGRVKNAECALQDMDQYCIRLSSALSKDQAQGPVNKTELCVLVQEMRNAVSLLSTAITELGRCRQF